MKIVFAILVSIFSLINVYPQNGKIIECKTVNFLDSEKLRDKLSNGGVLLKKEYKYLSSVIVEEITYESDNNKVKGYLAYPKDIGTYPCIIYNRGGNLDFGALNISKAAFILAKVASWGYVVVGSQYRGNMGGVGGKDEFGGNEINDIFNLIPLLANMERADTSKLGIYGWSRGGMMTYISLTKGNYFKAAVVGGGLSDLYMMKATRPVMEEVYEDLIPGYNSHKNLSLDKRSAIKFVNKISKTTPVLMMHGTSDWRVVPQMALDLSSAFIDANIPHRLVLFEGGDHGLNEFDEEVDKMTRQWFDSYLKEGKELPKLTPHGK